MGTWKTTINRVEIIAAETTRLVTVVGISSAPREHVLQRGETQARETQVRQPS